MISLKRHISIMVIMSLVTIVCMILIFVISENRYFNDSGLRIKVHKELLKESSWDYLKSLLWADIDNRVKENNIIYNGLKDDIYERYGDSIGNIINDINREIAGNDSDNPVSKIIYSNIKNYDDKVVIYRSMNKLYTMDDVCKIGEIVLYNDKNCKLPTKLTNDILSNFTLTTGNFMDYIYYSSSKDSIKCKLDNFKDYFLDGSYDLEKLKGISILVPTYIEPKRGLFGDRILINGENNISANQIIVLSRVDIYKAVTENPMIVKHFENFSRNAKVVDSTFDSVGIYSIINMVISTLIIILTVISIQVYFDTAAFRTHNLMRRSTDRENDTDK